MKDELRLHREWLNAYEKLLISTDEILCAVVVGSMANGTADRYSDVDLVCFAEREKFEAISKLLLNFKVFNTIHSWRRKYSSDHIFGKFIYDNFFCAEVHILSPENTFAFYEPYSVLKLTKGFNLRTTEKREDSNESRKPLPLGIEGMGWELHHLFNQWLRGNHDAVIANIHRLSSALS